MYHLRVLIVFGGGDVCWAIGESIRSMYLYVVGNGGGG